MRAIQFGILLGFLSLISLSGCQPKDDANNTPATGGGTAKQGTAEDAKVTQKGNNASAADKAGGGGATVHATPEAAFDALKSAAASNDVNKLMGALTKESQANMTIGVVMMGTFLPMKYMNDEAKAEALSKEVEGVMNKHGLTEEAMNATDPSANADPESMLAPIKDRAAFLSEMWAIINREAPDSPFAKLAKATVKDVKVDGDKATGTMVSDGEEQPIEFRKSGDGWLVSMPEPPGPDAGGPSGNLPDAPSGDAPSDNSGDAPDGGAAPSGNATDSGDGGGGN